MSRALHASEPVAISPLRGILKQSWPILISQWASIAFGVLDTAMTGHASPQDLAALALGVSIYITVFIGLMGVMHALIPIQAQSFGAKRFDEIGQAWSQGIWVSLILSVFGGLILSFPGVWLSLSGPLDSGVRERLDGYLFALTLGLPAALMYRTVYAMANAVSRPKMIMMINLLGIVLKAGLNWLLIFGHWGAPALGVVGAGIASALVYWISLGVGFWWVLRQPFFLQFGLRLRKPNLRGIWDILRLGLPMGASYVVEVCAFTFMALLIAREGTTVIGGHQITSNLAALCYMMPLAIGIATASQTAQALGAQQHERAHKTGMIGLVVTFIGALITALVLYFAREPIVAAYTSDPAVATVALSLLVILPWFHVIDAMHCANVYLLRAHKIAMVPLLMQTITLSFIGLGGGWYLGFGPGQGYIEPLRHSLLGASSAGASTMWLMAAVGLGLSTILLHIWYRHIVVRPKRPRPLKASPG
jgi:multidrug resistance protein, MATE family